LEQIALTNAPIIVGHSMAGLLAARLASDLKASGVICLDANMPPETGPTPPVEQSFRPILSSLPTEDGYLPPWHKWWPVDAFEGAPIDADLRARVESEIPRLKLTWFDDEFAMPDWSQAKRAFIRTGKWFDQEADKAEERGWCVVRLAGTHLHPTTRPAETASAILKCVEAMVA
jgi:pimeloyl-ACP methyl ester carboxylesterase